MGLLLRLNLFPPSTWSAVTSVHSPRDFLSQHLCPVVTIPVSQMLPTGVFKHPITPVFISITFSHSLPPPYTPRLLQNGLTALFAALPLSGNCQLEKLERLAKVCLLKVVNKGTL